MAGQPGCCVRARWKGLPDHGTLESVSGIGLLHWFVVPARQRIAAVALVAWGCAQGGGLQVEEGPGGPQPVAPRLDRSGEGSPGLGLVDDGPVPERPTETCALVQAPAVLSPRPVDVILVLDNSPSMDGEQFAVERSINRNFAGILEASGVDYRVIVLSRHRAEQRFFSDLARSSLCVEQPLSSLLSCPAAYPGTSERFFHYSAEIQSRDSLTRALGTYTAPDREFSLTATGWSAWLRPGSKKVFLEMTDDDSTLGARRFAEILTGQAPEHFGTNPERPSFVFHSIVGLAAKQNPSEPYFPEEPLVEETCSNAERVVTNAGLVYQELSKLTGGLRLPLCTNSLFDVVFERIAEDVFVQAGVACEIDVPEPPGGLELDLDKIAVSYARERGLPRDRLGQVLNPEDCAGDAFYLEGGQIHLCADACEAVNRQQSAADVQVEFACESTILIR